MVFWSLGIILYYVLREGIIISEEGSSCQLVCLLCCQDQLVDVIFDIYDMEVIPAGPPIKEMMSCHEKLILLICPILNPVLIHKMLRIITIEEFFTLSSDEIR